MTVNGYVTLNGKGTARVILSNDKEAIVESNWIAKDMQYTSWWETLIEGYSEHFEEWEEPEVDDIEPLADNEFTINGYEQRPTIRIVKILQPIDIEWQADEDTFIDGRET